MMEEDFKAPEFICIDNFRGGDYHPMTSEEFTEDDGSCTDYVRKDIAIANTRKAVEDALAELVDYLDRRSNKLDRAGAELYSVLPIIKHARELILNGYKYEPLKHIE